MTAIFLPASDGSGMGCSSTSGALRTDGFGLELDDEFHGTVSIRQALQLSLNVTAVKVLEAVGPARLAARLTLRERPFSEPSATIVWKTMYRLGIAETTVLWNALQMHPFAGDDPLTNRTPTLAEFKSGRAALRELPRMFAGAVFIAVGKYAERALAEAGIASFCTVRHPANGGATAFAEGLGLAVRQIG